MSHADCLFFCIFQSPSRCRNLTRLKVKELKTAQSFGHYCNFFPEGTPWNWPSSQMHSYAVVQDYRPISRGVFLTPPPPQSKSCKAQSFHQTWFHDRWIGFSRPVLILQIKQKQARAPVEACQKPLCAAVWPVGLKVKLTLHCLFLSLDFCAHWFPFTGLVWTDFSSSSSSHCIYKCVIWCTHYYNLYPCDLTAVLVISHLTQSPSFPLLTNQICLKNNAKNITVE